jgi:hypothetical protein
MYGVDGYALAVVSDSDLILNKELMDILEN